MSNHLKYINFEDDGIIIFPPHIQHRDMASRFRKKPKSAGFVQVGDFGDEKFMHCYGESVSLGIKADPVKDTAELKRYYGYGW